MEQELNQKNKISLFMIVVNIFLVIFVLVFVFLIQGVLYAPAHQKNLPAQVISAPVFDTIKVTSQAVYILDITKNTVIFEKNPLVQLPLGSLSSVLFGFISPQQNIKDVGLNETYFVNKNTGFGSAQDLGNFIHYVLQQNPSNLQKINTDSGDGNVLMISNLSIGRPIAMIILGSKPNAKNDDVQKLITASLAYIGE